MLTRRNFIPMLASGGSMAGAQPRRPNIVIIVADDLGWNDVGYHGSRIQTPHLDRLAQEGVRLDQFYCCPVCSPTRAGLLTGRYPIRYGMMHWGIAPYDRHGLPAEERTLAAVLRDAGYTRRAAVGKWHLGHARREFHPLSHGFTSFYGYYNSAIDHFTLMRDGQRDWHRDWTPATDQGYATDLIADEAIRFLKASSTAEPFFLYLAFDAPHIPLQAPEASLKPYRGWPEPRRTYAAMVTHMDHAIGRVLKALDDTGLAHDTVVLFLSDNGGDPNAGGDNRPFRGGKATTFEGGIRVPAILRWPRSLQGGRICKSPVRYIDVLPTMARLVGAAARGGKPLDGVDVWDQVRGTSTARPQSLYSFIGSVEREHLALMEDGWKLVRVGQTILRAGSESRAQVYLFRIDEDPFETRNLAGDNPKLVQKMLTKLRAFRALHPTHIPIHTGGDANRPPAWSPPKDWAVPEAG